MRYKGTSLIFNNFLDKSVTVVSCNNDAAAKGILKLYTFLLSFNSNMAETFKGLICATLCTSFMPLYCVIFLIFPTLILSGMLSAILLTYFFKYNPGIIKE